MPESDMDEPFVEMMRTVVYARATQFLTTVEGDISPALFQAALRDAFVDVLFDVLIGTPSPPGSLTTDELEAARGWYWGEVDNFEKHVPPKDWMAWVAAELQFQAATHHGAEWPKT